MKKGNDNNIAKEDNNISHVVQSEMEVESGESAARRSKDRKFFVGLSVSTVVLVAVIASVITTTMMQQNKDTSQAGTGSYAAADEDGEGYSITQSDEYNKETQEILTSLSEALTNQSHAILHLISRWLGTTKLAYFHIFDKRLFGNDNKEIMKNMETLMKKLHKGQSSAVRTFISGDSVVSFGFELEIK